MKRMKKELNLIIASHMELLQGTAFKAISGISVKEILELRNIYSNDRYEYFNRVKLKYIFPLGMLVLTFKINTDIEKVLFQYFNHLMYGLPAEQYKDSEVTFNFS
ncbi:hypothetical protein P2R12_23215 [Cytobacillus oceanisediminis]|uniref:hypothetical protein n=1 Tax=Cytobacillus oceanisediminis TaxID=665099 RepID=UPI0023DCD97B|nr:hypothetical protein [Cytobacillus oceanisediminis]MDF2039855.1 hypothetical protein [Cytobacillus oceanisediminis]